MTYLQKLEQGITITNDDKLFSFLDTLAWSLLLLSFARESHKMFIHLITAN